MKIGRQAINGSWYYFKSDGTMVSDVIINNFNLDNDGMLVFSDYSRTQVKLAEEQSMTKLISNVQ